MGSSSSKPQHQLSHHYDHLRGRGAVNGGRGSSSSSRSRGYAGAATQPPPSHLLQPAMPSFFSFQQGSERAQQNLRYQTEASPLLGRFRAVPRPSDSQNSRLQRGGRLTRSNSQLGLLSAGYRGSVHVGYGALVAAGLENAEGESQDGNSDGDDEDEDDDYDNGDNSNERDGLLGGGGGGYRISSRRRKGRRIRKFSRRLRRMIRKIDQTWVNPKSGAVRRLLDVWWSRWGVLVLLPAVLVSEAEYAPIWGVFVESGY